MSPKVKTSNVYCVKSHLNDAKGCKELYGQYCFKVHLALKEYGTRALSCANIGKLKIQIITEK